MMNKKSEIPEGIGLLISEVVENLQRQGYSITAQQIRQYEDRDLLFKSIRTKGNYREYTSLIVDSITFIRRLEIIGYSKKRIKDFFALVKAIKESPNIERGQSWDEEIQEFVFTAKLSVEVTKGSTQHLKHQMLIDRHTDICNDIKERFESIKRIMEIGSKDIEARKKTMGELKE